MPSIGMVGTVTNYPKLARSICSHVPVPDFPLTCWSDGFLFLLGKRYWLMGTGVNATQVIERLREHEQELRDRGIASISLFGSVARGEPSPQDVDLAVVFDRSKHITLFKLGSLQERLTELVGAPVDMTEKEALKQYVRQNAERDFVVVY